MNCHNKNNHSENSNNTKKGLLPHGILMILCCAIPILLLLALPYLNIGSARVQGVLGAGIFLLCPLMHVAMMLIMFKGKKKNDTNKSDNSCH